LPDWELARARDPSGSIDAVTVWCDGGWLSSDPIRVYLVRAGKTTGRRYFIPLVGEVLDRDPLAFDAAYSAEVVVTWPSADKVRISGKAVGVYQDIKAVKVFDGKARRTIAVETSTHY
jgi:hypothetical protein